MRAAATVSGSTRSAAPVSGSRLPSARAHTGRARGQPLRVGHCAGPGAKYSDHLGDGAASQQLAADRDRGLVIALTEQSHDVLAVAAARDGTQRRQRSGQLGAAGPALVRARNTQHLCGFAQHYFRGLFRVSQRPESVLVDALGEPLQVVDHPHQRAAACAETDRAKVGAQKVGPKRVHRGRHLVCGRLAFHTAFHPVGQRAAHLRGVPAKVVVVTWRQQKQRRRHTDRQRDGPAE
jgi:hypothetical protein